MKKMSEHMLMEAISQWRDLEEVANEVNSTFEKLLLVIKKEGVNGRLLVEIQHLGTLRSNVVHAEPDEGDEYKVIMKKLKELKKEALGIKKYMEKTELKWRKRNDRLLLLSRGAKRALRM